jgi:glucan phosphoethanolaminetransferase (alkaline phosphatase superfamily)
MHRIQRLFIIALFGAIIFVGNLFLPPPLNYLMMVVQSVLLALASLFIHKVGAMYVGAIGGLLTTLASPSLGPFTFLFAFLYGVFVDVFIIVFKVRGSRDGVNRNRLMAAMAVSTLFIAVSSYLAFTVSPDFFAIQGLSYFGLFLQRSVMLDALVLFMGPATGITAGYASAYLWNKYLRHICV